MKLTFVKYLDESTWLFNFFARVHLDCSHNNRIGKVIFDGHERTVTHEDLTVMSGGETQIHFDVALSRVPSATAHKEIEVTLVSYQGYQITRFIVAAGIPPISPIKILDDSLAGGGYEYPG